VDLHLRNFPQIEPFAVRWQYPLMVRDGSLDPAKLKKPRPGGVQVFGPDHSDVLGTGHDEGRGISKSRERGNRHESRQVYDLLSEAKAKEDQANLNRSMVQSEKSRKSISPFGTSKTFSKSKSSIPIYWTGLD